MRFTRSLAEIVDFVVRSLDPQSVILFGSVAQGRAGPNSDIDLLVIRPFREERALRGRELAALREQYAMPVDVQFYTPAEFEREAADPTSFAAMISRHGEWLYDAGAPKKKLPESSPRKHFQ